MTLVYLSNCAVNSSGVPGPFMLQELPWLCEHFSRVVMVGNYGVRTITGEEGTRFPVIRPIDGIVRACVEAPFRKELWQELARMRRDGCLTLKNALKLLAFTQRGLKMHYWAERMLRASSDATTTFYSFWMSYDAYAGALCKKKHPKARFVARGHAYDIDTERVPLNPYLMKKTIGEEADGLYLISQTAKSQYMDYMQGCVDEEKVHVLAMGSAGQPADTCREAPRFTQGVLRVVSCAQIIPIKQVPMLVEALAKWDGMPLCWTHIGGGEGEEELRQLAAFKLDPKENVICEILGAKESEKIQQIYETRAFDVFINTSRKEGVPISIMEAMRYGTPVIAPNVGGIPELVNPDIGWLFDPEEGADGVLKALKALAAQTAEESQRMREAAQECWNNGYCSDALLPKLFPDKGFRR